MSIVTNIVITKHIHDFSDLKSLFLLYTFQHFISNFPMFLFRKIATFFFGFGFYHCTYTHTHTHYKVTEINTHNTTHSNPQKSSLLFCIQTQEESNMELCNVFDTNKKTWKSNNCIAQSTPYKNHQIALDFTIFSFLKKKDNCSAQRKHPSFKSLFPSLLIITHFIFFFGIAIKLVLLIAIIYV